jgi:hypothetical protein
MTPLERYLKTMKPYLPPTQRQDILDEIADSLQSQMEDKEEELGRPLTEAEQDALLTRYGHPLAVAARYRQDNRTFTFGRVLIGSELFPFYLRNVKWACGLAFCAVVIIQAALSLNGTTKWDNLLPTLLFHVALQFTIQTGVWMLIQAHFVKHPESWSPFAEKPAVAQQQPRTVSRLESIAQIIVLVVLFPWIYSILYPQHVSVLVGELAPVWHAMYIPYVLLVLASLGQSIVNLIHPTWVKFRDTAQLIINLGWTTIIGILLLSAPWVILVDRTGDVAAKMRVLEFVNHYFFFYGLLGFFVGAVIQSISDIRRVMRHTNPKFPTVPTQGAELL